jgi:hypothetical protein
MEIFIIKSIVLYHIQTITNNKLDYQKKIFRDVISRFFLFKLKFEFFKTLIFFNQIMLSFNVKF